MVANAGLRLKYRITVDPPLPEERDWERPEILVEFAGPDSALVLERGAELLRSIELLAIEMLRLPGNEHEKISFDCMNHRSMRIEELRMAANVAAEKVRKTGAPYRFAPMSSRERRIVHLALRDESELRTESEGEGMRRCLVVYPKDYRSTAGHREGSRPRKKFLATISSVNLDDTIVAIATPAGRGGIGVVRLAGADACAIAAPMLRLRTSVGTGTGCVWGTDGAGRRG